MCVLKWACDAMQEKTYGKGQYAYVSTTTAAPRICVCSEIKHRSLLQGFTCLGSVVYIVQCVVTGAAAAATAAMIGTHSFTCQFFWGETILVIHQKTPAISTCFHVVIRLVCATEETTHKHFVFFRRVQCIFRMRRILKYRLREDFGTFAVALHAILKTTQ